MRIVFIGTGEIGVPTLRALLRSPSTNWSGWSRSRTNRSVATSEFQAPPIKAALAKTSVPILQPARIETKKRSRRFAALAPDVDRRHGLRTDPAASVLEIPRIACLNLHASLLPRHRGAAPIQAAIVAGDTETGITVMYMDEGLDTGDILLQAKLEISPDETGGSLHDRLAQTRARRAARSARRNSPTGQRAAHSAGFRARHLCAEADPRTTAKSIGRNQPK